MSSQYDVFLCFRGEDTRHLFVSHLKAALRRRRIKPYIDDDIEKGKNAISSQLLHAIEKSKLFVIVLSGNFATSSWCLDELEKILECRDTYEANVIPVFYRIDPADVRNLTGRFSEAFAKHGERFDEEKIGRWRDALKETANLAGWSSTSIRREAKLVDKIAEDVKNKLRYPRVKAVLDWFVIVNFILELTLAAFIQLSSVQKPQYALVAMIISVLSVLGCVIHLICSGRAKRVRWLWKWPLPWFYHPPPSSTRFGVLTEIIGSICAVCQCITTTISYCFIQMKSESPIKISVWSVAFSSVLLCSIFLKKSDE